jgi:hypothetical protein
MATTYCYLFSDVGSMIRAKMTVFTTWRDLASMPIEYDRAKLTITIQVSGEHRLPTQLGGVTVRFMVVFNRFFRKNLLC